MPPTYKCGDGNARDPYRAHADAVAAWWDSVHAAIRNEGGDVSHALKNVGLNGEPDHGRRLADQEAAASDPAPPDGKTSIEQLDLLSSPPRSQ